ncbi:MAG: AarF/UbiB family protein [Bdellovibrionota bacterium]
MESAPERLRLLFETLGPTFIKIGQLAAGRPDLVPTEYIRELQKLQDKVETIPYSTIKNLVENGLGRKIENLFSSFDTLPLASASIAQVHAARTLTGEDVVLKIQKPDVDRILHKDFEILELMAELAEATIPETTNFNPLLIVKEFKRLLLQEIDFEREARTIERYQKNFSHSEFLVIPKVYKEFSTKRF